MQKFIVVLVTACVALVAVGPGVGQAVDAPSVEEMRQWTAPQWIEESQRQGQTLAGLELADRVRLHQLWALCQMQTPPPGLVEEAQRVADRVFARFQTLPAEAREAEDFAESSHAIDLSSAGYVMARLGQAAAVEPWARQVADLEARADLWSQVGWGVSERREAPAWEAWRAQRDDLLKDMDPWDRVWWNLDDGALWLLMGDPERAHVEIQKLSDADAKYVALVSAIDLALELDLPRWVQRWQPQAEALAGLWGEAALDMQVDLAGIKARQGDPGPAQQLFDRVRRGDDPWLTVSLGSTLAVALHRAEQQAASHEVIKALIKSAQPPAGGNAALDEESLSHWETIGSTCWQTQNFDLLGEVWEVCGDSYPRARVAAAIAVEMIWTQYTSRWQPKTPPPI